MTEPLGEPFASGRDADVFAVDPHRVLRRYRNGVDTGAEAALMRYVHRLGFPVPEVYRADGADLVMERLHGPTMVQALAGGELGEPEGAAVLADLHRRLHALPARPGAAPGTRIVHLDLHPANVVLSSRGPVLIDWRNATDGPPELDLALSALILAEVAVDPTQDLAVTAAALLSGFLREADGDPLRMLDRALGIRRTNVTLDAGEKHRLDAAAALVHASR